MKIGGGSGISACGSGFLFTAVSYHGLLISAVRCCSWLLERPQSSTPGSCMLVSLPAAGKLPARLYPAHPHQANRGYGGDLSYPCVIVNINFTLYILGSLMPTATIASMNNCLFFFMFAFLVPVYRCTLLLWLVISNQAAWVSMILANLSSNWCSCFQPK